MTEAARSVAIVGLGVLGGSIARAVKRRDPTCQVLGADLDPETLRAARSAGSIDRTGEATDIVRDAQVVVYATPLHVVVEQIRSHTGAWREDALVMDVASLKVPVLDQVEGTEAERHWIGAHPMAGAERTGFAASRETMFDDARVWLTSPGQDHRLATQAEAFWRGLGGNPKWADARAHDHQMVAVSHLPQLTANALASLLNELGLGPDELGPGGRDMIRLAGSAPEVWVPLFDVSAAELQSVVLRLARRLEALAETLSDGRREELTALMEETRSWKERAEWS